MSPQEPGGRHEGPARLRRRLKALLANALTLAAGVGLGAIAARFRLLDSPWVVAALGVVMLLMIVVGIWAMAQPWDGWDD